MKNSKDFNEKYKLYLDKNHYGNTLDKLEALEYLDKEFQELIKIPGFKYQQIKPKFNSFRFYAINVHHDKSNEIEKRLGEIYSEKV